MRRYSLAVLTAVAMSIVPMPAVVAGPAPSAPALELATPVENVRHREWHYPRGYCHRSVQRHLHRGYGRTYHRHVGPRCRIQVARKHRDGCFRIGDVRICF